MTINPNGVGSIPCSSLVTLSEWGTLGSGPGQFNGSYGIVADDDGFVYATDLGNHRVQKFTASGEYILEWGTEGSGEGELDYPGGIDIDSQGNLYVVDTGNYRIQKFSNQGAFLGSWGCRGSGDGQFVTPNGVAIDASDHVYVVDTANFCVQKFDSAGTFLTRWELYGEGSPEGFGPDARGIAIDDSSGRVYVSILDFSLTHFPIQIFSANGDSVGGWGTWGSAEGEFGGAEIIAISSADSFLYAIDHSDDNANVYKLDGTFICSWGESGTGVGEFYRPGAVGSHEFGLLITQAYSGKVQLWGGSVTAIEDPGGLTGKRLVISDVFPNPTRSTTGILLTIGEEESNQQVDVQIFDFAGRLVRKIHAGPLSTGRHHFEWKGYTDQGKVPAGVYFMVVSVSGSKPLLKKLVRLD
jgi:DNA-binding beta-propeller fold protein YncE